MISQKIKYPFSFILFCLLALAPAIARDDVERLVWPSFLISPRGNPRVSGLNTLHLLSFSFYSGFQLCE